MRCCIYKERAIISQRVKLAMGGDKGNPNLVEVLPIACDECPVTQIAVGPACRGCIATRCVHTCPKDAISIGQSPGGDRPQQMHHLRQVPDRLPLRRH